MSQGRRLSLFLFPYDREGRLGTAVIAYDQDVLNRSLHSAQKNPCFDSERAGAVV